MIRKGYSCKLFPQYHNLSLDLHYQQNIAHAAGSMEVCWIGALIHDD